MQRKSTSQEVGLFGNFAGYWSYTVDDKILNRVKKMLAIAECSGATEAERDTALQMAYKVLAAHNLSMVDLDAHVTQQQDPREMANQTGYGMPWAKSVYHNVAEMFFCKYFGGAKVNADKITCHFVGRQSNAMTAMSISQFIVTSLLKEVRKSYGHALCPEARSFCVGAASRLGERIREIKKQQQAEAEQAKPGNAMVLANLYDVEKQANALVLQEKGVKLHKASTGKTTVNSAAFGAGQAFDDKINLSPQIGANKSTTRKIGN